MKDTKPLSMNHAKIILFALAVLILLVVLTSNVAQHIGVCPDGNIRSESGHCYVE